MISMTQTQMTVTLRDQVNGHPRHPFHFVSSVLFLVEDPSCHLNELCVLLANDDVLS